MASVKKNFLYNVLLVISNIFFPVLVFPYIARILGPAGIGNAQFALQFSKYFMVVASVGIPVYGMREVAKVKHQKLKLNKLVSELIILHVVTAIISTIIYVAVVLCSEKMQDNSALFYVAGLQVLLGFLSIDWVFGGLEDFRIITIRSLTIRIITAVFLFLFVKATGDVLPYLTITILSIVLGHLWNLFYVLGKIRFVFRALSFTKHITPIMLIFMMNVCISMYTIFDTSWVGFLSDAESVGLYTSAIKLSKIAMPVVTVLGTVLIPRSARAFAADIKAPGHIFTSYNFVVDLSVPICFGLFILAPELLVLFSGDEFSDAVASMRMLSLLPLLIGLNNLFGMQILSASGNDKAILIAVFTGMMANIILNLWLIPLYAHNGASIAMIVTELIVTLATFLFVYFKYKLVFNPYRILKAVGICLLFIPCTYILRNAVHNTALMVVYSVSTCALIYLLIQHMLFKNEFISQGINLIRTRLK